MANKIGIFDIRGKYILHLVLILATMFLLYPLGDMYLKFQEGYTIAKMFVFFIVIFYLADNIYEYMLKV